MAGHDGQALLVVAVRAQQRQHLVAGVGQDDVALRVWGRVRVGVCVCVGGGEQCVGGREGARKWGKRMGPSRHPLCKRIA